MSTIIGSWNHNPARKYGTEESYRLAAEFLDTCDTVEDWGCGKAEAKPYFKHAQYIGIDGTAGYADQVSDLRLRRSDVDGILIRHVLEHNLDWRTILENALDSFRRRLVLCFFLEPQEWTSLWVVTARGVPNLNISGRILEATMRERGLKWSMKVIDRNDKSPHKHEWLYLVERK